MKLQDQLCTRKQGDKIQALGIIQFESAFCYCHVNPNCSTSEEGTYEILPRDFDIKLPDLSTTHVCDLFTVAELGVMLPGKFAYQEHECFVESAKYCEYKNWIAGVHTVWAHDKPVIAKKYFPGDTEAQVRADLLIHLLETNTTTAEEVNARLKA